MKCPYCFGFGTVPSTCFDNDIVDEPLYCSCEAGESAEEATEDREALNENYFKEA